MVGGFVFAALGAGKLRLGGDQLALAGLLEDAGPVTLQVGLDTLQCGYGGVQAGELLLNLRHDAMLFCKRWEGERVRPEVITTNSLKRGAG